MKNNSRKYGGFTLIEVVICMAILSIISIGVYDGCILITKQIKAGKVKQLAAIEGKKIIETMKANNFMIPDSSKNDSLSIGNNIMLQEEKDNLGNICYTRYLNENYSECSKSASKYVEKVTLTTAKSYETAQTTGQSIQLNTNDTTSHLKDNKLYISKIDSQDYMRYWEYNSNSHYTPVKDSSTVPIPSNNQSKIEMSAYFTNSNGYQNIEIKDNKGQHLLSIVKTDTSDKDLVINFSNYINSDGSIPTNESIELDVYNKTTTDIPKIYIEKSEALNFDVEARKGEINIYDNRSEDAKEDNIGTLYDIKLEINEGNNNLFTGYYKRNI